MRLLFSLGTILLTGYACIAQEKAPLFTEYGRFDDLQEVLNPHPDTTYVINFWATWCAPCIRELPYFTRLHQETADQNIKVVLVSLDMQRDLDTKLARYLTRYPPGGLVLVLTDTDANAWIPRVSDEWDGAIPATLIRKGDQTHFHEGEFDSYEALWMLLEEVIAHND
jgi:thiol-disulfide isomerase/thioredoxin